MLQLTKAEQVALNTLARSRLREEADRARAMLLTAEGWSSRAIAQVIPVHPDSVRRWRCSYRRGGIEALRIHPSPGRPAHRGTRGLEVLTELLKEPRLASEPPWTLPRLQAEVEKRCGIRLSPSYLSRLLRKKGASPAAVRGTPSRGGRTAEPLPPPPSG